jgi:ankyrin repeat protein
MALQALNGFEDESSYRNEGKGNVSKYSSSYPSKESIMHIFEEQMKSNDAEVRLNFIRELLSGSISYAPKQMTDYALSRMLFVSAYHSDMNATEELLENGVNINELDIEKGMTALALAMNHANHDYITYLLGKGANLFATMGDKETVFEWIMYEVSDITLQCILDNSPTICTDLMNNPEIFDSCIEDGRPSNIALLLNHFKQQGVFVNVNPNILLQLAYHVDAEVLRKLFAMGFDIDIFEESAVNALYLAIKTGNSDMVSVLIEKGILTPDQGRGEMALHYAISSERVEVIQHLISLGIDVNTYTETGAYPLLLAAETGNSKLFDIIMEQGPELINHDLDELIDAMNFMMKILHPEIIDLRDAKNPVLLNQKGIDCDSQIDSQMLTNISHEDCLYLIKDMLQMEYVAEQCIYAIKEHGRIDINQKSDETGSLLHFAASKNLIYAIRVLLNLGGDINSKNGKNAETPLMTAINHKHKEASMLLIELGADCELEDEFRSLPLIEAIQRFDIDHRVVIELLRAGVHDHGLNFVADN